MIFITFQCVRLLSFTGETSSCCWACSSSTDLRFMLYQPSLEQHVYRTRAPCRACGSLIPMGSWISRRTLWQKPPIQDHLQGTRSSCTVKAMRLYQATSNLRRSSCILDGLYIPAINTSGNTIEATTHPISSPCPFLFVVCALPTCMISL